MFIDWLTLLLVNMMVALVLHSLFMGFWIDKDPKKVIPGFLLVGAIALIAGFRMAFTWPLPGAYNIIYGELSVLLGAFFFMAGLSIHFGWNLLTIGIYSLFGGAVAVLMGVRIWVSGMTSEPFVGRAGLRRDRRNGRAHAARARFPQDEVDPLARGPRRARQRHHLDPRGLPRVLGTHRLVRQVAAADDTSRSSEIGSTGTGYAAPA